METVAMETLRTRAMETDACLPCSPKGVWLGRKTIKRVIAYHWAVKVDGKWFEIAGASKTDADQENIVRCGRGNTAASGVQEWVKIGTTTCTWGQITTFIRKWLQDHPTYSLNGNNCQVFGTNFAEFLCGPEVLNKLPAYDHFKFLTTAPVAIGEGGGFFFAGVGGLVLKVPILIASAGFALTGGLVKTYQWKRGFNSFPDQLKRELRLSVNYKEITANDDRTVDDWVAETPPTSTMETPLAQPMWTLVSHVIDHAEGCQFGDESKARAEFGAKEKEGKWATILYTVYGPDLVEVARYGRMPSDRPEWKQMEDWAKKANVTKEESMDLDDDDQDTVDAGEWTILDVAALPCLRMDDEDPRLLSRACYGLGYALYCNAVYGPDLVEVARYGKMRADRPEWKQLEDWAKKANVTKEESMDLDDDDQDTVDACEWTIMDVAALPCLRMDDKGPRLLSHACEWTLGFALYYNGLVGGYKSSVPCILFRSQPA